MTSLLQIWRLLDRSQRRRLVGLQCLAVLMAFSTLGGIAALAPFLMVLADPSLIERYAVLSSLFHSLGFSSPDAFIVALGGGFVAVVVAASILNFIGTNAMTRFALLVGDRFHAALLDEYLHRDYLFHARNGGASLFNKVVYSVNRVATGMLEGGMLFITNGIMIVLIVASILALNPWVASIAVIWIGGSYLLIYALARRRLYRNGELETGLIAARARYANESLAAIREVQVLGIQNHFRAGFELACRAISRVVASNHAIAHTPRFALECVTVAGLVGAAVAISRNRDVAAWLAELTFLGFAAYRLAPAIQQLFAAVVRIRANTAIFEEVADDLRLALARAHGTPPEHALPGGAPREHLCFDEITFAYQAGAMPALSSVSLQIAAGSMVGIVGANGSGKTTLLEIALGLLRPQAGRFLVDGQEVGEHNLRAWQACLAYVPQQVVLLDATLEQNVALGVLPEAIDRERLASAVRLAQLDSLVRVLPHGLAQRIGEGGMSLSGGQRQRVAIARALYRDSGVLVMDEATSALDGLNEKEILEVLRELRGKRTILFVAHRMSIIRECDCIFLLERGEVTASGSYGALMESSAPFRALAGDGEHRSVAAITPLSSAAACS